MWCATRVLLWFTIIFNLHKRYCLASNIFLPMLIANDTNYFNKWKNVNDIVNTMNINKLSLIIEKTYVFFRLKEIPVSCSKF